MATDKPITAVIVERGVYRLGLKRDGDKEYERPPKWEPRATGGSVIVCAFDTEKDEPIGEADIFSRFDATLIERKIQSVLNLTETNTPTALEIFKGALKEGVDDLCQYCPRFDCRYCGIKNWKDEKEDGE